MTTVAVMQPYFLPYAGYFRLFAVADIVAFFDCVQFPRRGWVHRNRLPDANGNAAWLTLPLCKAPVETTIREMRLAPDASTTLRNAMRRFPDLASGSDPLIGALDRVEGALADYVIGLLRQCCRRLELPFETVRTSDLGLEPDLTGQDRVLAAAAALGADRYVNLEGGRSLYDPSVFAARGMDLQILPDWQGARWSILHRFVTEPAAAIARDIRQQL
jgi:hypothetical protein